MGGRLGLVLVLLVGLLALATLTFPLWYQTPDVTAVEVEFPELPEAVRPAFGELSRGVQQAYLDMRDDNVLMATSFVTARLAPPEPLPPEEQEAPPGLETMTVVAEGEFDRPARIAEEDLREGEEFDDRDLPPYVGLFNAEGRAIIYQDVSGARVLRIEDLQMVNGPDLRVMLSSLRAPLTGEELLEDRARIDLGPLQNPAGSQTYLDLIPREINLGDYNSIVIHNPTYGVVFAVARI
jgi:hypothetical protein